MRRILSAASSLFLSAQARMGGNTGSDNGSAYSSSNVGYQKDMASNVDFQTFDLDGQVHDLMWCGYNNEVVLMHTSEGSIYRSRDRGLTWKRLKALMQKSAYSVADEDQEVRRLFCW